MGTIKKIEQIFAPPTPHFVGDGFRVHGFIPGIPALNFSRMDPFLVMDYNSPFEFPPSATPRGVGVHPHKGFETVTIAYQGKVEHKDSSGGGGIIEEGDIQWMTAGSGILHKEFHEKEWSKKGGMFQMVQLWVNLPAKDKSHPPRYQTIKSIDLKQVSLPENAGEIEVIAGEYKGVKGNAQTFSPVYLLNAKLRAGGRANFTFKDGNTTALLVVKGSIKVNDKDVVPTNHFVLMSNQGEDFQIEGREETIVLVLNGEPLNEPIAAHGPFVMNTRDELLEAFDDFNRGKFGYLE